MSSLVSEPELVLLPAIDIADGKTVRLVKGEAGTETDYGSPLEVAEEFIAAGAEWIHLVDLDAAFGRGSNAELIDRLMGKISINVELSGGIRDTESLRRALDTGAKRVNIGTAALEDPTWTAEMIAEYGSRIAIGLDVRGTTLAARGWTRDGGNLYTVLEQLEAAQCHRYVVTDVNQDGTLQGPNLGLLEAVCEHTSRPVIASGGISSLDDIAAIRELVPEGVEGAILGKALYSGRFTLAEALDVARG